MRARSSTCSPAPARSRRSAPGCRSPGASGTLADVFTDSPVTGRLRAKTGTLGQRPVQRRPAGGEGAVRVPPGRRRGGTIQFSLLLNGPGPLTDQSQYRPIWDALAAAARLVPDADRSAAELAPPLTKHRVAARWR